MSGSSSNILDAIAHPATLNVLGAYQGAAQTAGSIMDVQAKQAQQAWGQALAAATDRVTGVVDYPQANRIAAANPVAARGMAAGLSATSQLTGQQLEQAKSVYETYGSGASSVLSNPSDANVNAAFDSMIAAGRPPGPLNAERARVLAMSADDRKNYAYQHQLASLSAQDNINRQQTMGMSPENYYKPIDIQIGNGQTVQVPAGMAGLVLSVNPNLAKLNPDFGKSQGAVTNKSFGPNEGRYSAPPAQPGAPAPQPGAPPAKSATPAWLQPPPPPVQGGAAGGLGVTAAPGYVESQQKTAAASTAAATTLQSQLTASRDIEPILADMEAQLGTKGFTPGVGSTTMSSVRQLFQRFGLVPEEPGPGVDLANPQAAQELFAKNSARLQAAQMGTLGNPTDARQELAEVTNPGLLLSKYGNLGIVHMLQGNQQATRVMGDAWSQAKAAGWTPDRFNEWMNERFLASDPATNGRFDPRVFWFANEGSLDAQKAYAAKVPPGPQRQQFLANLRYAKNNGWITQAKDGTTQIAPAGAQ